VHTLAHFSPSSEMFQYSRVIPTNLVLEALEEGPAEDDETTSEADGKDIYTPSGSMVELWHRPHSKRRDDATTLPMTRSKRRAMGGNGDVKSMVCLLWVLYAILIRLDRNPYSSRHHLLTRLILIGPISLVSCPPLLLFRMWETTA
jgi:hypothetical protein